MLQPVQVLLAVVEVVLEGAVAVVTEVVLPHGPRASCHRRLGNHKHSVKSREERPHTKARGDEGAEGKLRTKHKLTPPTPGWDLCDIPRVLLAALKLREGRNKRLTEVAVLQDRSLPQCTNVLVTHKEKALLAA